MEFGTIAVAIVIVLIVFIVFIALAAYISDNLSSNSLTRQFLRAFRQNLSDIEFVGRFYFIFAVPFVITTGIVWITRSDNILLWSIVVFSTIGTVFFVVAVLRLSIRDFALWVINYGKPKDEKAEAPAPDEPPPNRFLEAEFKALLQRELPKLQQYEEPGPKIALMQGFYQWAISRVNRILTQVIPNQTGGAFLVRIDKVIPNVGAVIAELVSVFTDKRAYDAGAGIEVRDAYFFNQKIVSTNYLSKQALDSGKRLFAADYRGDDVVAAYLPGTPFEDFFKQMVHLPIANDRRFRHQWVVAPSGSGKTTLLETQIADDLTRVARGECSLVIIDSQGMKADNLIGRITRLQMFAPGQPMHDKLVLLEPNVDMPLALNIFDMDMERAEKMSSRDIAVLRASALEMVKFSLHAMTDKQDDLLDYAVQLVMRKPGATMEDLVKLLQRRTVGDYGQYIDPEHTGMVDFFATGGSFEQGFKETKLEVLRRISGMLKVKEFVRMFTAKTNSFRMLDEINAGKVICIYTDLELLKRDGCTVFGRFFIAQLLQASEMRGQASLPVFCYIDECTDYIADYDVIAELLDKARKRNVGLILSHQRLSNIKSANVLDALSNVAIRIASQNQTDAGALARALHTTPEFIQSQYEGTMACYIQGKMDGAVQIQIPEVMKNMTRMTEEQWEEMRRGMLQKYGVHQEDEPPDPDSPVSQTLDDEVDTPPPEPPKPRPPPPKRKPSSVDPDNLDITPR